VRRIVKHLKEIAEPQFNAELTGMKKIDEAEMRKDELFDEAVRVVLETKRGSVSLLQRRLSIGYARASRIIEMMASSGILGEYKGSQAREVMITLEEYEALCEQMDAEEAEGEEEEYEYEEEEVEEEVDEETEPVYVSEGQREYMAVENDDEE
jgi:S-DNA-T family DNA segregation ATPase FtsK/SpoIIIE